MKGVTCIWTQLTGFLWFSHLVVNITRVCPQSAELLLNQCHQGTSQEECPWWPQGWKYPYHGSLQNKHKVCVCAGVSPGSFSLPFDGLLLDPFSVQVSHPISSCYTGFALWADSLLPCPTSLPFLSSSPVYFLFLIWSMNCSLCFDAGLISKALSQANAGHGKFYVWQ